MSDNLARLECWPPRRRVGALLNSRLELLQNAAQATGSSKLMDELTARLESIAT
jgi:hypothetical protein